MDCVGDALTSVVCQWLSIRPGISVRPSPRIRRTVMPAASAIGALEIVLMTLPATSTLDGPDSSPSVPSKMRTFSKHHGRRRRILSDDDGRQREQNDCNASQNGAQVTHRRLHGKAGLARDDVEVQIWCRAVQAMRTSG